MQDFTLHQLRAFDAVVQKGSFQAAADYLNKTHPSVHSAVQNLENQAGLLLFDRTNYRVSLTEVGLAFHADVRAFLEQGNQLKTRTEYLATGAETALSVVIGDISPLQPTLSALNAFFKTNPMTRLNLLFENLSGPIERLLQGDADMIIHYVGAGDMRFETIPLYNVPIIPVVAAGFLNFDIHKRITSKDMAPYPQCIIRDTAQHIPKQNHFVQEHARHWTVGDQHTKKEIIQQGMAWGHLPLFLIEEALASGQLLDTSGKHFRGNLMEIAAIRLQDKPRGIVANKLWQHMENLASTP